MENKIPIAIIGLLARIMDKHYTHNTLTSLFMSCDFQADLNGTKQARIQTTLANVNKECSNPLGFLGNFISEIMERDDEYVKDDKDAIRKMLSKYGLEFRLGKIVPISGMEAGISNEETFLSTNFAEVQFVALEQSYADALNQRLSEMRTCISNNAPLSVVFMAGSTLEGILGSLANQFPKEFNTCPQSPKRNGIVLPFSEWTLANLIDVSHAIGYLREDVKKFSVALRDFRNYIHPREQVQAKFNPDMHTAKMCLQVLCATMSDLDSRGLVKDL